MEKKANALDVRIRIEMVDTPRIERRSTTDDPVDLIEPSWPVMPLISAFHDSISIGRKGHNSRIMGSVAMKEFRPYPRQTILK